MNSKTRNSIAIIAVVALGAATAVWLFSGDDKPSQIEDGGFSIFVSPKENESITNKGARIARPKASDRIKNQAKIADAKKNERPDLDLEIEAEAKLTEEIRLIYEQLQAAFDANDRANVIKFVQKLQSLKEWPDDIPNAVKLKALDALAWFGAPGMVEAVGFLADRDEEVVQSTIEKFDEMLSDVSLGDKGAADILSQIVKVVHDRDAIDTFLMRMNDMRPTVKAELALQIYHSGNQDAIAVMDQNVEFVFSDSENEIATIADIEQYLENARQEYIDSPEKAQEDEEFYGAPALE